MAQFILGLFIGAGIVFIGLALWNIEERKKQSEYEKWRAKLP